MISIFSILETAFLQIRSVDREVWEHLNAVLVENLVLDPALGIVALSFECTYLQTMGWGRAEQMLMSAYNIA